MSELTRIDLERETRSLNDRLQNFLYGSDTQVDYKKAALLFKCIISEPDYVEQATTICTNKYGEKVFCHAAIARCILENPKDIPASAFNLIANTAFSDLSLLRTTCYRSPSFLYNILLNENFCMTDKQKIMTLNEAMNCASTMRNDSLMHQPVYIEENGELVEHIVDETEDYNARFVMHGGGTLGIKYEVLMNPNFTDLEKSSYLFDLYPNINDWIATCRDAMQDLTEQSIAWQMPKTLDETLKRTAYKKKIDNLDLLKRLEVLLKLQVLRPADYESKSKNIAKVQYYQRVKK